MRIRWDRPSFADQITTNPTPVSLHPSPHIQDPIAVDLPRITERDDIIIQRSRESVSVIWVTKQHNRGDLRVQTCRDLLRRFMRDLRALANSPRAHSSAYPTLHEPLRAVFT